MPEKEAAHKINHMITAQQVRVVGENVETPKVVSLKEALAMADEQGLDLVEISPKADPPVCRIVDYSKFLYQQKKKAKENLFTFTFRDFLIFFRYLCLCCRALHPAAHGG